MANISKIKIPGDNTEYIIKDNSQTYSNHRHYDSDIVPLVHKVYESTSYYGTTNDWANTSWYFMSVKPDEWYKPWRVKLKVHTYCPAYSSYHSYTWSTICGREAGTIYANWNEKYSSAHTYLTYYPLKKAGFDAGYGHAIGVSIYNADSRTSSAYYRTFEIDYYECENCTVTILDTPVKWANWSGTGTTNYGYFTYFDATSRGLQETSDSNEVESRVTYFAGKTGIKGIWATSLFMEDANGTYQNICTASDGTVTANNRTTATTKIANTNGFKVGSTIYYANSNYNANTAISGWGVVYSSVSAFDSRYALNTTLTATSLTAYAPVYLVGTIDPLDGLYYLDTVWWTQTPNDPDKVYVLIGGCYDSSTSYCRISLNNYNPWYYYNGSSLVRFIGDAQTINGHTVEADVPANAKFTDTTYTFTNGGTNKFTVTPSGGTAQDVTFTASDSTKVAKAGDAMTGTLRISTGSASYGEGIRINLSSSGYSTLLLGASSSSTSGTADGAYWIGTGSAASYKRKLYIGHNCSTASKTYFYADSSTQYSPHLRVGGDVFITPSNADTGCKMQYNSTTESLDFIFA